MGNININIPSFDEPSNRILNFSDSGINGFYIDPDHTYENGSGTGQGTGTYESCAGSGSGSGLLHNSDFGLGEGYGYGSATGCGDRCGGTVDNE